MRASVPHIGAVSAPETPETAASFSFGSSQLGDTVVVDVAGEIDMSTGLAFERAIALDTAPGSRVVVNLSKIGFADSTALNALVDSWHGLAAKTSGLRVVVPADRRDVRKLFEITGLVERLGVVGTLDEALT